MSQWFKMFSIRTLFFRPKKPLRCEFSKFHRNSFSTRSLLNANNEELFDQKFPINEQYFHDEANQRNILQNIRSREMCKDFPQLFQNDLSKQKLAEELVSVAKWLPNNHHPVWNDQEHHVKILEHVGSTPTFDFKPSRAEDLLHGMNLLYLSSLHNGKLGIVGGPRSYMFVGQLAKLARALSQWTLNQLIHEHNFIPVVTPNMIYADFIRACGFEPFGERTQVYTLEGRSSVCLAGTAEMPLAALNVGENYSTEEKLPKKYCALSRCYRAEAKSSKEMSGLYRVHYFDKVEMFALTNAQESDLMLEEFVRIEKSLFEQLELHFRIVDMPPNELGPAAYRKFDIEAYMPGRDFWGEISSASNCTDYQTKRLNITYNKFYFEGDNPKDLSDVKKIHCHTVNGTACAIPRIIIAIVEQNQNRNQDYIMLPKILHKYMDCDRISMTNLE